MAIARSELVIGGKALYRSRPHGLGGFNTAWKLEQVDVLDVNRGAAKIRRPNGSVMLAPFGLLQADEAFLDEHERKEQQKRDRIQRERILSEQLAEGTLGAAPLTYTLADKLKQAEPEAPVATQSDRDKALRMLEELKRDANQPWQAREPWKNVGEPVGDGPREADELGQSMSDAYPKQDREEDQMVAREPVAEAQPAPPLVRAFARREDLVQPEPAPAPSPPPLTPVQRMLKRLQDELEQLIGEEAEIEPRVAALTTELAALNDKLATNRARQKVLAAQERTVLAMPAPEAPAVAQEQPKEAPQAVEAPLPPANLPKRRGRPPGSKNKPKAVGERPVLHAAELAKEPVTYGQQTLGPGWLRRRGGEAAE